MSRTRRAMVGAVALGVLLGGCGGGSGKGAAPAPTPTQPLQVQSAVPAAESTPIAPVTTGDSDWSGVASALGRSGTLMGGTVYRVGLVRSDLKVHADGVSIAPGLSLGGYAAFAKYPDGSALMMGDLVVTEAELGKVTDALQSHGIAQTALHKHLPTQTPAIWWTHVHAHGDPVEIAKGLKAALTDTGIQPAAPAPSPAPTTIAGLDTKAIDTAIGRAGKVDGGLYKFGVARSETIADDGMLVPPAMGVTTAIAFQPLGSEDAAINGDFATIGTETQKVISALRGHGIEVVTVHNHLMTDSPRLFFVHFWAHGKATELAQGLKAALEATAVKPGP